MLSPLSVIKYVTFSWSVFYILVVLFGAPIFSDILATAALAASLTLVSAVPAVILFDSEEQVLEVLFTLFSGDNSTTTKGSILLSTSTFAVLGAWAAAAVHPLDWDRWWQRYPLPSLTGCFIGSVLGLLVGSLRVYTGKRTSNNKPKRR